jgi:hypothetical protein
MPTPTRIYLTRNIDTGEERLVRAPNAARALAHITRTSYEATVATQDQLVALLTGEERIEIEDAMAQAELVETEPAQDERRAA